MAKELFNATKNMKDFYPVILVGGSSATDQMGMDRAVRILRRKTKLDIVLFPGNITGVVPKAHAILFSCLMNSEKPILYYSGPSAWSALGKEDETGGSPNSISNNW